MCGSDYLNRCSKQVSFIKFPQWISHTYMLLKAIKILECVNAKQLIMVGAYVWIVCYTHVLYVTGVIWFCMGKPLSDFIYRIFN